MINQVNRGRLRRWLSGVGGAIKQGILGKSSHAYMKQFSGGDEFWDALISAHSGAQPCPTQRADRDRESGIGLSAEEVGHDSKEVESEPVHGSTKRQFDDYAAGNPGYLPGYEAELRRHRSWAASRTGFHPAK